MGKYLREFMRPMPLLTLAVSLATFWITGIWWIVLLGFAAAGIVTVQSAQSPREGPAGEREGGDYEIVLLDPQLRSKFQSILDERARILNELKESSRDSFLNVEEISNQVGELVDSTYRSLLKIEKVRPFINPQALSSVKHAMEELKARISGCTDEVTRANLSLALKNKTDQANALLELDKFKDRVESQLVGLVSALNSLHVRIVQLKVSPDSSLDPTSEIKATINNMLLDVEISEKVTRDYHRILNENLP